ncbi:MAG: hypothetical protein OH335_05250 [Candidatus Parvarchaeota archaeon]|nr:hypothetical protein [Candidatus Jingweiarchaeum tengchongense]MCW1306154.1 hypothetical protein [Candidatus Jingweiarchaeum tengchongense]
MEELFGYAGKILRVNLKDKIFKIENADRDDARMYLGGTGLSAKILYTELQRGIDPLSSENKIIFSTGPLTATAAPGSGSVNLCFKSPLTGIWGEARSGSDWGSMLRKAGYDILIIEGRSPNPVYLVIENDKIEIHDAFEIVGFTTSQKTSYLKQKLGKDFEIAAIGPAGENKVFYSSVMFGEGRVRPDVREQAHCLAQRICCQ